MDRQTTSHRLRLYDRYFEVKTPVFGEDVPRYERVLAFDNIADDLLTALQAHGYAERNSDVETAIFLHNVNQNDHAGVGQRVMWGEAKRLVWQHRSNRLLDGFFGYNERGEQPRAYAQQRGADEMCDCAGRKRGDEIPAQHPETCSWTAYTTVRRFALSTTGIANHKPGATM